MKSISAINATIMTINLKVGVSLNHGASLCFVSLPTLLTLEATFQAMNRVRSTHASTVLEAPMLTLYFHNSCEKYFSIICVLVLIYSKFSPIAVVKKRKGVQRGSKVACNLAAEVGEKAHLGTKRC